MKIDTDTLHPRIAALVEYAVRNPSQIAALGELARVQFNFKHDQIAMETTTINPSSRVRGWAAPTNGNGHLAAAASPAR